MAIKSINTFRQSCDTYHLEWRSHRPNMRSWLWSFDSHRFWCIPFQWVRTWCQKSPGRQRRSSTPCTLGCSLPMKEKSPPFIHLDRRFLRGWPFNAQCMKSNKSWAGHTVDVTQGQTFDPCNKSEVARQFPSTAVKLQRAKARTLPCLEVLILFKPGLRIFP